MLTMRAPHEEIVINPRLRGYSVRRYYDPSTGQFISVDPAVDQTEAPYAYVDGDPVNLLDPRGLGVGSWINSHVVQPIAGGVASGASAWWEGAQEAASVVACTVTQHPGWVAAGIGFSVVALATGGLGVAVLAGVLPDGAIVGLGSLEGLDAVHVGGTFLVIGSMSASGAIASFYEASGAGNGR